MTNTMVTLEATLQELITTVVAGAETAGAFVVSEAPVVIEQLLAWRFTISLAGFVAGLILACLVVPAFLVTTKGWFNKYEHDTINALASVAGTTISILLCVFAPICVASNLTWLQIAIAPKLYLLEYAADLIK